MSSNRATIFCNAANSLTYQPNSNFFLVCCYSFHSQSTFYVRNVQMAKHIMASLWKLSTYVIPLLSMLMYTFWCYPLYPNSISKHFCYFEFCKQTTKALKFIYRIKLAYYPTDRPMRNERRKSEKNNEKKSWKTFHAPWYTHAIVRTYAKPTENQRNDIANEKNA